jgi:segregation and condensation protein A
VVSVAHLHAPAVSVREQAGIVSERLRRTGTATFRSLTADCSATIEIVARFLALLELFREALVSFEQVAPLGDLLVRWTGSDDAELTAGESDWPDESPEPADSESPDIE